MSKTSPRWPGSIEILKIRKSLTTRSSKTSQKTFILLLRTTPRFTALRTVCFPAITRNGFCFHIRKIISHRPWPPTETPRYRYCIVFFVDSIYSKIIDIIKKIDFLFLNRRPMCKTGDRDCCSAADGSGSCHAPAPSYFEEMARCRC